MQEQKFSKRDWALFRDRIGAWQERYICKLNQEYMALLNSDATPSKKFWELEKRIKEDKKKPAVQLAMTRSNFIYNIVSLINDSAIVFEDLEEFSDELKESVKYFTESF